MRHSFFLLFFRYHLASVLHSTYLWAYHVHWTLEFMTEAFIWNRTIRVKYTVLKNWKGELLKNWNGTDAIEVTSFRASLWESFSQLNWITFVNSTGEEKTNFFLNNFRFRKQKNPEQAWRINLHQLWIHEFNFPQQKNYRINWISKFLSRFKTWTELIPEHFYIFFDKIQWKIYLNLLGQCTLKQFSIFF